MSGKWLPMHVHDGEVSESTGQWSVPPKSRTRVQKHTRFCHVKMVLNLGCCYTVMKNAETSCGCSYSIKNIQFPWIWFCFGSTVWESLERLCLNKRPSLLEVIINIIKSKHQHVQSLHYRFEACSWSIWQFPCRAASVLVAKTIFNPSVLGERYFKTFSWLS